MRESIAQYNRQNPINNIKIRDIQQDGIIFYEPTVAKLDIIKNENTVKIIINDYVSPTIMKRLELDTTLFHEQIKITDFKSQIDAVLIDTNYDGNIFHTCKSDIPEKKSNVIEGQYELSINDAKNIVAVKIIDIMGEELIITG